MLPLCQQDERTTKSLYTMNLISINQIPRGAVKDGFTEEVETPGFGKYFIVVYTKGIRRYFELRGWYTGREYFSTSIKDDREMAIRQIRDIADARVNRYRKED